MIENISNALPKILEQLPLFPSQASTVSGQVDALYLVWSGISLVVTVVVFAAILYFGVRYRRRHEGDVGGGELHAPAVEVISMVVPFVVAMVMFAWGAQVFVALKRPPENSLEYFAFGKQWMWKYQHPNGRRQINNVTVPVDTPIKLTMTSEDVIHSFWVPDFRVKQDVVPGRYTTVWFEATKTGVFRQFCAEYCGSEHSLMGGKVTVLSKAEYEEWLNESDEGEGTTTAGEDLFTSLACNTCHIDQDVGRGPSLHGLFGKEVQVASGTTVRADEEYIRESILRPRAKVKAGYSPLMPTFEGQVSEEQLVSLISYVKGLESIGQQPADSMANSGPETSDPAASVASGSGG